jgi:hypothetical protein
MPQARWVPAAALRATMDHPIQVVMGERLVSVEFGANRSSFVEPGDMATLNAKVAAKMAGSTAAAIANQ